MAYSRASAVFYTENPNCSCKLQRLGSQAPAPVEVTKQHPLFLPDVTFENLVEGENLKGGVKEGVQQRRCTSLAQLEKFWAVEPTAVNPADFTLLRLAWTGVGTFQIDQRGNANGLQLTAYRERPDYSCNALDPRLGGHRWLAQLHGA